MQVLAKITINENLFNKVMTFCLHFINKVILAVNSKQVKQNWNMFKLLDFLKSRLY